MFFPTLPPTYVFGGSAPEAPDPTSGNHPQLREFTRQRMHILGVEGGKRGLGCAAPVGGWVGTTNARWQYLHLGSPQLERHAPVLSCDAMPALSTRDAGGPTSLPRRQANIALIGAVVALFLGSLDQTIIGTAMPKIGLELGGFTEYTLITTVYIITSTIVAPITGRLSDIFGRKRFYILGLAVFVIGSLLCGVSQNIAQLVAFRGIQGAGAGVLLANAFIYIGDLFPPAERGKYQGLTAGVFGIAAVMGPMLGGFITDSLGWRWVFLVNVPVGLILIGLFALFLPRLRPASEDQGIDYLGIGALVLATVPLMLALSWAGVEYPWVSAPIIAMLVCSATTAAAFVLIERRATAPIIPLWVFGNRIVTLSLIIVALTGVVMYGGIVYLPLYFQGVFGMSPTTSGGFLTPLLVAVVVGSLVSGQVLSRAGGHYRLQGAAGLTIMAIAVALIATMSVNTGSATAVAYTALIGLGLGIIYPLYTIAVQNAVPYSVMGVTTSSATFFRALGGVLGLAIAGSLVNNRFAPDFLGRLAPDVAAPISPEPLNTLAYNPEALVSPEKQAELLELYEATGPQGLRLYDQMFQSLKLALDSTLTEIFVIGVGIVAAAWIANWFIAEVPLRRHHE